jgi:prophage regulatory protein
MSSSNTLLKCPDRIISLREMSKLTSKSPKTIWRWWSKEGVLPKPLIQNGRTLGWKESTYTAWLAEKAGA